MRDRSRLSDRNSKSAPSAGGAPAAPRHKNYAENGGIFFCCCCWSETKKKNLYQYVNRYLFGKRPTSRPNSDFHGSETKDERARIVWPDLGPEDGWLFLVFDILRARDLTCGIRNCIMRMYGHFLNETCRYTEPN